MARKTLFLNPTILLAILLMPVAASQGAERSEADTAVNRHVLTEYGACGTRAEARKAFRAGMKELMAQGGGVLVIPNGVAPEFRASNPSQPEDGAPAVTVIDYRGGVERILTPPLGIRTGYAGTGYGSRIVEREISHDIPAAGARATQRYVSRYTGGTSSYMQGLSRASTAGRNERLYLPTLRGLFVGQKLIVSAAADASGGGGRERITVTDLGLDGHEPYLVADLEHDHPAGVRVFAKNVVNGLTVTDINNADNQSSSLIVDRRSYGTGDSFGITSHLTYQGGFMSGQGDEGGVAFVAEIRQDLNGFRGVVERWSPKTRELIYRAGGRNAEKLGTSRPIINLNAKKWERGKLVVLRPKKGRGKGRNSSLVLAVPGARFDGSLVGRFLAIDEPSEYYAAGERVGGGHYRADEQVYRWWHITGIERQTDGRTALYVECEWWGTERYCGPRLIDSDNYSKEDQAPRELRYIIAPGAWAADVRNGVASGRHGDAQASDTRRILLAPAPSFGSGVDFASGDPITQPPTADVWLPTGVRVRHFDGFPGMMGGMSFSSTNAGRVQVGSGLAISSKSGLTLSEVLARQKDHKPPFDVGVNIHATTRDAIRVKGPVQSAALDLWSTDGNVKKLRWRLPPGKGAKGGAAIFGDPKTGNLVFEGGGVDLSRQATVRQAGISQTATAARNLRGIDVAVPTGAKSLEVAFVNAETDPRYSLAVQASWRTQDWVTRKTKNGFDVSFSEAAPSGAKLDWQLIR